MKNERVFKTIKLLYELTNKLINEKEICFDTETTSIDANEAELVGLSFSIKEHEGFYVPCPADRSETEKILAAFKPLFDDESKTWIGQNIKYDLLVLRQAGVKRYGLSKPEVAAAHAEGLTFTSNFTREHFEDQVRVAKEHMNRYSLWSGSHSRKRKSF